MILQKQKSVIKRRRVTFGSMPRYRRAGIGKRCYNRSQFLPVRIGCSYDTAVAAGNKIFRVAKRKLNAMALDSFVYNLVADRYGCRTMGEKDRKVFIPYRWFEEMEGIDAAVCISRELSKWWDSLCFGIFVQTIQDLYDCGYSSDDSVGRINLSSPPTTPDIREDDADDIFDKDVWSDVCNFLDTKECAKPSVMG